jgi:uncharacterized protein
VGLVCGVLHDRLRDEPVVEGVAVVHRQPHEHQQMFGADAILTAAPPRRPPDRRSPRPAGRHLSRRHPEASGRRPRLPLPLDGARLTMAPPAAPAPPAIWNAAGLARFIAAHPALLEPLRAVAALGLPDAWIGAGFLRNPVWDALAGLAPGTNPPGDVDVVWFDPARATAAADAAIEARLRATHPDVPWSVRNQARMATRHGDAPYADTLDAMAHWTDTATAVAARLGPGGAVEVAAPWGVDDLLAGVVRPTPACAADPARREAFARRIASKGWLRRWPGLRVLHHPPPC